MAWSATFVHVMDIGAMSPGGNSPGATEICHEGLRIPGLKLVERGRIRQDVFRHADQHDAAAGAGGARPQVRDGGQQRGPGTHGRDVRAVRPGAHHRGVVGNDPLLGGGAQEAAPRDSRRHLAGRGHHRGQRDPPGVRRAPQARRSTGVRLHRQRPPGAAGHQPPLPRHLRRVLRGGAHRPGLRPAQELRRLRPHRGHRPGGDGGERAVSRAGVHEHHLGAQDRLLRGRLDPGADAGGERELEGRGDGADPGFPCGAPRRRQPVRPVLRLHAAGAERLRRQPPRRRHRLRRLPHLSQRRMARAELPAHVSVPAPHPGRRRRRQVRRRRGRGGHGEACTTRRRRRSRAWPSGWPD